jgi:hypothetical protein
MILEGIVDSTHLRCQGCHAEPERFFQGEFTFLFFRIVGVFFLVVLIGIR